MLPGTRTRSCKCAADTSRDDSSSRDHWSRDHTSRDHTAATELTTAVFPCGPAGTRTRTSCKCAAAEDTDNERRTLPSRRHRCSCCRDDSILRDVEESSSIVRGVLDHPTRSRANPSFDAANGAAAKTRSLIVVARPPGGLANACPECHPIVSLVSNAAAQNRN